jgi:hypothetical protein
MQTKVSTNQQVDISNPKGLINNCIWTGRVGGGKGAFTPPIEQIVEQPFHRKTIAQRMLNKCTC